MKKIFLFLIMTISVTMIQGSAHERSFPWKIAPVVGSLAIGGATYAALQRYLTKSVPISGATAAITGLLSWLIFYKCRANTHQEDAVSNQKILAKVEKDLKEIEGKPEIAIALRYTGNVQEVMKEYTGLTARQQPFPLIALVLCLDNCGVCLDADLKSLEQIKADDGTKIKSCELCAGLQQEIAQCDPYIERIKPLQKAINNLIADIKMQTLYFQQQTGSLENGQSLLLGFVLWFMMIEMLRNMGNDMEASYHRAYSYNNAYSDGFLACHKFHVDGFLK